MAGNNLNKHVKEFEEHRKQPLLTITNKIIQ